MILKFIHLRAVFSLELTFQKAGAQTQTQTPGYPSGLENSQACQWLLKYFVYKIPYIFLKITEDSKELLFVGIISITFIKLELKLREILNLCKNNNKPSILT